MKLYIVAFALLCVGHSYASECRQIFRSIEAVSPKEVSQLRFTPYHIRLALELSRNFPFNPELNFLQQYEQQNRYIKNLNRDIKKFLNKKPAANLIIERFTATEESAKPVWQQIKELSKSEIREALLAIQRLRLKRNDILYPDHRQDLAARIDEASLAADKAYVEAVRWDQYYHQQQEASTLKMAFKEGRVQKSTQYYYRLVDLLVSMVNYNGAEIQRLHSILEALQKSYPQEKIRKHSKDSNRPGFTHIDIYWPSEH